MLGTYALSAGYYDAYYGKALKVRRLIADDFAAAYEHVDVLLTPTSPTVAFPFGDKTDDPLAMYLCDIYTIPSNLSGHPAMSVPFGTGDDGLPVGVQVLAPALGEPVMFRVAAALERAADGTTATVPVDDHDRAHDDRSTGYELVVGLEVHVELATATKLFCGSPEPLRRRAEHQHRPGDARAARLRCRCSTARRSSWRCASAWPSTARSSARSFHRKNYFYPDMPKAYQISQYDVAAQRRRLARPARRHAGSASSGPTSRRTPASRRTSAAPAAASTAATTR